MFTTPSPSKDGFLNIQLSISLLKDIENIDDPSELTFALTGVGEVCKGRGQMGKDWRMS